MSVKRLIKQKPYEKIIYLLRRHWLIFVKTMLPFLILAVLPVGIYWLLHREFPGLFTDDYTYPLLIMAASIYYLCIILFTFNAFLDYYLDAWVVTNDRIINIRQIGLFARTVSEMDIYKVQDATSEVKGIFQTMFNYGHVRIETAGEKDNFDFEQVSNPNEIRHHIIEIANEDRQYHTQNNSLPPTI